ncbi:BCCT family transporter, partial [Clavibacter michiganensis]|uniref:BCCT family transporter n=1 Tax=Clavibacter michiganensis TaxID=28447 RepID=UPI002930B896
MTRAALRWWSAFLGVVAALAVLAVVEIAAAFVAPAASPVLAVGALVIDLVPAGVKDTVIALFGTGDKVALIVVLGVVVLAAAALAGILQVRRPPLGVVVLALFAGSALYALMGMAFGYFAYRHNLPLSIRSALHPIFG